MSKCPQIVTDSHKNYDLVHTPEIQAIIADWIDSNLRHTSTYRRTGYGLKHCLQFDTDIYLHTEDFIAAMHKAGFKSRPCVPGESLGANDSLFQADLRRRKHRRNGNVQSF